ncbi:hypothetical protein [Neomoorella thermoacetica]|nr:hypothetical protein [Moorella thermoacetica]
MAVEQIIKEYNIWAVRIRPGYYGFLRRSFLKKTPKKTRWKILLAQ